MTKELLVSGHTSCAGCGEALGIRMILEAAGSNVIIANATGCSEIFTSRYPESAWEVAWIHSLFENAPAVATGIRSALQIMGREDEAKVIAMGGDGAMADIGFGALSGMFDRGDDIMAVCLDNEAYMNTGIQKSSLTPFAARTRTTPPGKMSLGNVKPKKDMARIAAAHGVPYVATASVAYPNDLEMKIKKGLSIGGPKYVQVHVPCPLGWVSDPSKTVEVAKMGVLTALFPLVEIENGIVTKVKKIGKRRPVEDYLRLQGRFKHLFVPKENKELIATVQEIADENARRYGLE